jgi:hypothetical protein
VTTMTEKTTLDLIVEDLQVAITMMGCAPQDQMEKDYFATALEHLTSAYHDALTLRDLEKEDRKDQTEDGEWLEPELPGKE